jgi:hypothetical protein
MGGGDKSGKREIGKAETLKMITGLRWLSSASFPVFSIFRFPLFFKWVRRVRCEGVTHLGHDGVRMKFLSAMLCDDGTERTP